MSNPNEISELRADIKEQTREISNLTASIAQLVEQYKYHKEVTDKHTQEITILHEANNVTDEKINNFLLEYKHVLDKAKEDQAKYSKTMESAKSFFESRSVLKQRVLIAVFCAASVAIGAKAPDLFLMFVDDAKTRQVQE